MNLAPCPHRPMMMGRGTDGGCSTEEKPRPIITPPPSSRLPSAPAQSLDSLHFYAQAQKALSVHSPFDREEALSRVPTLPVAISAFLSKCTDRRRRKQRKSLSDTGSFESWSRSAANFWDETEEYFRHVALEDVERLVSRPEVDSDFSIPVRANVTEGNAASAGTAAETNDGAFGNGVEVGGLDSLDAVEETDAGVERMEVDSVGAAADSLLKEAGNSAGLHWLLGCKHKVHLTSERPSKKRKLLSEGAGLERLVVAQPSRAGDSAFCDVCCSGDSGEESNGLLLCKSCNVSVHHKCYGVKDHPAEKWLCSWCKQPEGFENSSKPCLLCPKHGGALKPVAKNGGRRENGCFAKFAHLFCCMWMPELYVEDMEVMEPIVNIGSVKDEKRRFLCFLCKMKYGVCIRCSNGTCRTSFHPICAREAKLRMEIWGRFGCDNVELRAFCSKHSSEVTSNSEHLEDSMSLAVGGDSSVPRLLMKSVPVNRLIKLKLGSKNVDKSTINGETVGTSSCEVRKNVVVVDPTPFSPRPNHSDAELAVDIDKPIVIEKDNIEDIDACSLVQTLYEVIKQGKITVKDAATQMGIPIDLLSAALKDDYTAISSELHMKIVQWLQDSAHVGTQANCLKFSIDSAISFADKVAKTDDPNTVKVAGPVGSGAAMPLAPGGRLQSRIRILKERELICSSGNPSVKQNGNQMPVNGTNGIPHAINEPMKEKAITNRSNSPCQDFGNSEEREKDSLNYSCVRMGVEHVMEQSQRITEMPCDAGVAANLTDNVSEKQLLPQSIKDKEPLDSYEKPCVSTEATAQTDTERSYKENFDFAANCVTQCMHDTEKEESASTSHIHPFIKKKLMQMCKSGFFQKKNSILECHDDKNVVLSTKETWPEPSCCSSRPWSSTCTDLKSTFSDAGGRQLGKARKLGILDLAPEDEVEGEIVYFQSRLLDNAVALKRHFEYLLLRVVSNLPKELEALCKQRWDEVLVNKFFRQVKETKKRGRKERMHREAQAVLAAAASSRISSLRKDALDEMPSKINTVSGRAGVPRAKETLLRLTVPKNSPDPSEVFQLTSESSEEHRWSCDICRRHETISNQILVCCNCKVAVHSSCYKGLKNPSGPWYCEACEEFILKSRSPRSQPMNFQESSCLITQCGICGGTAGAFRKAADGQWIHSFCAEWVLESTFRRGQADPVVWMEALAEQIDLRVCCICHRKHGVCIKCNHDGCQTAFHPTCAKSAGLFMNVTAVEGRLLHKAYCGIHSLEQRRKAESQYCGPDELCRIKHIRVELEKLRLLCERIVKREKVKKELVLCSHDILASKRDNVAFSMLVRSSLILPELSSDSVTTSLKGYPADRKSSSGTRQRSGDVTADSTVSDTGQLTVPMHMDIDRKTDDNFLSQPSTCKPIGKVPSSGKQLSNGPISIATQDSIEDGRRRLKTRKHTETFKKEMVMTSEQASLRNMRLPKGYVYVPVDDLLKDKPSNHKTEFPKPLDPNG